MKRLLHWVVDYHPLTTFYIAIVVTVLLVLGGR